MRRFWLLLLLPLLAPAQTVERVIEPELRRIERDRGPVDRIGFGTAEDLLVDLGGGAAVGVLSGNLMVQLAVDPRGDLPPGVRGDITYNSLDAHGSEELGPGWTWDLGRRLVPGPWGERLLIDADGFQDAFFAGPLPTEDEARRLTDELVRAWKRSTPLRDRRDVGGEGALREVLASDPLFFGELRGRLLGPAPAAEPGSTYHSLARGPRSLNSKLQGGETELSRADGGTELYDPDGDLLSVSIPGRPQVELVRKAGLLATVKLGGRTLWHVGTDSFHRLRSLRSGSGGDVRFEHLGDRLRAVVRSQERVEFGYDPTGRLVRVAGPEGVVLVEYDVDGRVKRAVGPSGGVALELAEESAVGEFGVSVSVASGTFQVRWNQGRRERSVTGPGVQQRVRYAVDRPLPVRISQGPRVTELAWDRGGRLERVAQDGREVRFEREGTLSAIIDGVGREVRVDPAEDGGLAGWTAPGGQRTSIGLSDAGLLTEVAHQGRAAVRMARDASGALASVSVVGGSVVGLRRDSRGFLRAVEASGAGVVGLQLDRLGRLQRYEPSGAEALRVNWGPNGRPEAVSVGSAEARLEWDEAGRLAGFGGARIERGPDGHVSAWRGRRTWRVGREAGWPVEVRVDGRSPISASWDGPRLQGWTRPGRPDVEFRWDGERVQRWSGVDGPAIRRFDRFGSVIEVQRGTARWGLVRSTWGGLASFVAGGVQFGVVIAPNGSLARLSPPLGPELSFGFDPMGRLDSLALGERRWLLRRDRAGRPRQWTAPGAGTASLRWDPSGRWAELELPGRSIAANHGWAPTQVGGGYWSWAIDGACQGWRPLDAAGGWSYERAASGLVAGVVHREPARIGQRGEVRRERRLERDASGQLRSVGPWRLGYRGGRLERVEGAEAWAVRRRPDGRAEELLGPAGKALVARRPSGEARSLRVEAGAAAEWVLDRDSMGRFVGVRAEGLDWRLQRDQLGRPTSWATGSSEITLEPLDGSARESRGSMGEALGVEASGYGETRDAELGSVRLGWTRLASPAFSFELRRDAAGRFAELRSPWGDLDKPAPSEGTAESPALGLAGGLAPVPPASTGDAIAAAIAGSPLSWGGAALTSMGEPLLPSPSGPGPGQLGGDIALGLPEGLVAWLPLSGGEPRLRLPGPAGAWLRAGGLEPPTGHRVDGPVAGGAVFAEAWWSSLRWRTADLGRFPEGLAVHPIAWARPRLREFSLDARLPVDAPDVGPGMALPPTLGAERLLPSEPGWAEVEVLEALVLAGDLPSSALEHRGWGAQPSPAWKLYLPAVDELRALAHLRAFPGTRAPEHDLIAASPDLRGLATALAQGHESGVELAVPGLPAGTPGWLLGGAEARAASLLPAHADRPALAAIDDDPLLPHGERLASAEQDSTLLALLSLAPRPAPASGRWLRPATAPETWAWTSPSGARVVFDGRGRLLSFDLGFRLNDWFGRIAVEAAGVGLLRPPWAEPRWDELERPTFLPEPSDVPESAWGLAPADPEVPVGGLGELRLPAIGDRGVEPARGTGPLADL